MSNEDLMVGDGRSLRRQRNVEAVLDAALELFVAGDHDPRADRVAARAGVSLRSIHRYYPEREQMVMAALERAEAPWQACSQLDDLGQGPLAGRIERFVAQRVRLHEVVAPVARVSLVAAMAMPSLAERIGRDRAQMRDLVDVHFGPELGALDPECREELAEAVDVLCQFESVETLRVDRGLTTDRVEELLVVALTALLARRD